MSPPNTIRSFFPVALLGLLVSLAQAQDAPVIKLPADPSAPIIVLDWNYTESLKRQNMAPALTVQADGRVTVNNGAKDIQRMISASEVQALLRFAIDEQKFFQLSAEGIMRPIWAEEARTNYYHGVEDAAETVIRIKTADGENEVRLFGASFYASIYPTFKSITQFYEIEKRLKLLREEVRDGKSARDT